MRATMILFLFVLAIGCETAPTEPGEVTRATVEIVTVDESSGSVEVDAGVGWTVIRCNAPDDGVGETQCLNQSGSFVSRGGLLCDQVAEPCVVWVDTPGQYIVITTIIP